MYVCMCVSEYSKKLSSLSILHSFNLFVCPLCLYVPTYIYFVYVTSLCMHVFMYLTICLYDTGGTIVSINYAQTYMYAHASINA